jgi:predicted PurR-regulated permease PerM
MASPGPFSPEPRRIVAATLVVAAVIAGFAAVYFLSDVLFLLFIGVVLATALKPVIEAIQRRRVPQPVAVFLVYACIILMLVAVITVGVPYVASQVRGLASDVPRASKQAHQWLDSAGDALWANVAQRILADLSFSHAPAEAEQALATVGQTASYLATAARGLLIAGVAVLLAFYWSLQGDRTVRWVLLLLPLARREGARDTIDEIEAKVGDYIRSQRLVCLVMAGMASGAYALLGLRYAIVLGLVAGLLEVVPVLGPTLGAIPPLGVALFTDPGRTPWVLLAAILMQQAENYLLVPRVMDKGVGVHPMVTLLAITAFGSLFGIAGAILAIPLAAILQVLLNRYVLGPAATEPQQPSGRGALSVLHYETQELLRDIRLRNKAEPSAGEIGHLEEAIEAIARDLNEGLQEIEGRGEAEGQT